MSRIGKKASPDPAGVTANVDGQTVKVKGPKGELSFVLTDEVVGRRSITAASRSIRATRPSARAACGAPRARWSTTWSTGVTKGFEQQLEITGVGYRAAVQGKNLQLALGYSHDVVYPIPEGITIATPKPTEIVVTGIDKQKVGQVAAEIRAYPSARALQGQGREICRRIYLPQGRQEEVTEPGWTKAQGLDRAARGARARAVKQARRRAPRLSVFRRRSISTRR